MCTKTRECDAGKIIRDALDGARSEHAREQIASMTGRADLFRLAELARRVARIKTELREHLEKSAAERQPSLFVDPDEQFTLFGGR